MQTANKNEQTCMQFHFTSRLPPHVADLMLSAAFSPDWKLYVRAVCYYKCQYFGFCVSACTTGVTSHESYELCLKIHLHIDLCPLLFLLSLSLQLCHLLISDWRATLVFHQSAKSASIAVYKKTQRQICLVLLWSLTFWLPIDVLTLAVFSSRLSV